MYVLLIKSEPGIFYCQPFTLAWYTLPDWRVIPCPRIVFYSRFLHFSPSLPSLFQDSSQVPTLSYVVAFTSVCSLSPPNCVRHLGLGFDDLDSFEEHFLLLNCDFSFSLLDWGWFWRRSQRQRAISPWFSRGPYFWCKPPLSHWPWAKVVSVGYPHDNVSLGPPLSTLYSSEGGTVSFSYFRDSQWASHPEDRLWLAMDHCIIPPILQGCH